MMIAETKKYNICQVVRHCKIAGTEKHVLLLASKLNRNLFEISVCAFESGELANHLNLHGIRTKIIPKSHSIFHFLQLVYFFIKHRFDIIHSHSGGYACIAAKIAGCKNVVYTKHGIGFTKKELEKRGFIRKLRDLLVDECVFHYIALTEYDKYIMTSILNIKANKITVIHNGIDSSISKTVHQTKNKSPTIGVVCRLTKQKGLIYLIEAIPLIIKKYHNLRVLIAGSGEEELALKNLAKRKGILKHVNFLGYVTDSLSVINQFDVFILPSLWEGFQYVLLEAMLMKKPVVATNIFGINEIIKNGRNGILVKPRCPDEISNAVLSVLGDKRRAAMLSEAAHKKVLSYYTLDRTVKAVEQLYISI